MAATLPTLEANDPPNLQEPALGGLKKPREQFYWLFILCLLGLDYFSTLAYQPSLTFQAAGRLGPLATAVVLLVTLFGALPIYVYLAGRSPAGQGSLGLLERLVRGWRGKTLVLVLLGFAATDFTMLKAISLADASVHLLNHLDPDRHAWLLRIVDAAKAWLSDHFEPEAAVYADERIVVTLMLSAIGFCFWFVMRRGFTRNVLFLAVPLITLYLALTGMMLASGLWYLAEHPAIGDDWLAALHAGDWQTATPRWVGDDWGDLAVLSFLFLPNLALGLSGFELNMILMPQVRGKKSEPDANPAGRVKATRKVLLAAALVMSVYLLASVVVTTLLIPLDEMRPDGLAHNCALAYLAHGGPLVTGPDSYLPIGGPGFGILYDVVTVLILCLAGSSVMTGLAALVPQFLSRFGMEFRWVRRWGITLGLFAAINLIVTVGFKASVDDQRGAYATGVLVMIASAGLVTVFDKRQQARHHPPLGFFRRVGHSLDLAYFSVFTMIFVLTMLAVALRSWSGILIAGCFIAAILGTSIFSRSLRANEGRNLGFDYRDEASRLLWDALRMADFPILVPIRPGRDVLATKENELRDSHNLSNEAEIVFLKVDVDDPSNFYQRPVIAIEREGPRFIIHTTHCVSVSHTIAAVALALSQSSRPPAVHFGWPEMDLLSASWHYLAFGEGNIAWKVRELIHRQEPSPEKRPRVVVG